MILVAVFGIISAFVFAWEPAPTTTGDPAAPAAPVVAPQAAQQPVYPPGGPPGMIYDAEHNSWHFPPTTPHK